MCAAVAFTASAVAREDAEVIVTIKGGGEVHGQVKSERRKCKRERVVRLLKRKNGEFELYSTDTTEKQGEKWVWNAGNPGNGTFKARVKAIDGCEADSSKIIEN